MWNRVSRHTLCAALLAGFGVGPAAAADAETITVYRDKMGVPHVYAKTAPDAFYGAAHAMAQDRLARGETNMRVYLGRMAEILGPSMFEADRRARLELESDAETEAQFRSLTPEYQDILRAMHGGWNAHLDEIARDPARKLPYEFKEWGIEPGRWTLWQFLQVMGSLQRAYGSGGGGRELNNLAFHHYLVAKFGEARAKVIFNDVVPLNDPDAVPIIPGNTPKRSLTTGASRQWHLPLSASTIAGVVETERSLHEARARSGTSGGASRLLMIGASRSASGHPIMLHATADGPDVHISGGGFDVAGFILPPMCPVIMGRTSTFGFTFTTGESDLVDIYAEKLNPQNPRQYWYNGAWHDMVVRRETIVIKGQAPREVELEYTVHGPVIAREDAQHVAYSRKNAIRGHELAGLAAMLDLDRAKDLASYRKAAERMVFNFNVNYAGVDGHIALFHSGLLPLRPPGIDPRLPVPGTGEYEWQGFIAPADHSFVVDPPQGYIHAWNNKVTARSPYGDTSRYGKSFRTWLGRQLVESKAKISLEDVKDFNRKLGNSAGGIDLTVTNPGFFAPYLRDAARESRDPRLQRAVEALLGWNALYEDRDGDHFYDDVGLTLYRAWVAIAHQRIIGDDIEEWWHRIDDDNFVKYRTDVLLRAIEGPDAGEPMKYDWFNGVPRNQVLRATLEQTLEELQKKYGSADMQSWRTPAYWMYYDVAAQLKNPDKIPFVTPRPWPGTTAGRLGLQPPFIPANLSESWNMLIELKPGDTVLYDSTPSGGQNQFIDTEGHGNPNIADQVMLHANFQFKAVELERASIEKTAVSVRELTVPMSQ